MNNNLTKINDSLCFYVNEANEVIYYSMENEKFIKMKGVDIHSFKPLTNSYSLDKKNIYYGAKKLFSNYRTYVDYEKYGYFKIDSCLYWFGKKVDDKFDDTLTQLINSYFKSSNFIIKNGIKLNLDTNRVKTLNYSYIKDDKNVFYGNELIPNANVESFRIIPEDSGYSNDLIQKYDFLKDEGYSPWAIDSNHVYLHGEIFFSHLFDLNNTVVYPFFLIKDKNSIYYLKKEIKHADPSSFEPIFKIKAESFSDFNTFFWKDKSNLFFFYEDLENDIIDDEEILLCTQNNKDLYIENLLQIYNNKSDYNLTIGDIEKIEKLLEE